MSQTSIAWTNVTDNIIVVPKEEGGGWWCRKISEGCGNCFAARLNQSDYFGGNHLPYTGQPPKLVLRTDIMQGWARQRTPKRHFVASMTDVFGEWVDWAWQLHMLRGMWKAPRQTFQVLTKRPQVMQAAIERWLKLDGLGEVPANIWVGTSVENQQRADERVPHLLKIPARVKFLSCEPLLGSIDLTRSGPAGQTALTGTYMGLPYSHTARIDWVIVGGESGPRSRPCHVAHVRHLVRQCAAARVPCFVKQLGAACETTKDDKATWPAHTRWWHRIQGSQETNECGPILTDPKGGKPAAWPADLRVQQFPQV